MFIEERARVMDFRGDAGREAIVSAGGCR